MPDPIKASPGTKPPRGNKKIATAKHVTREARKSKALSARRKRKKPSATNAEPKKLLKARRAGQASAINTNGNEKLPFRPTSKLAKVVDMLRRPKGASLEELTLATGWQEHSVRGALAGALKKKLKQKIVSEQVAGTRRYRIGV